MIPTHPGHYAWPLGALPELVVSGSFAIRDRNYQNVYRIPHLAIHLYDYAADLRLGGTQIALRPGDVTLTPPGVESRYHLPRPGRHWCAHVLVPTGGGRTVDLPLHMRLGGRASMARQRMVAIIEHHRRTRGAGAAHAGLVAAGAGLLELLCWLAALDDGLGLTTPGERAVARAADLLRERPAHPWRTSELAAMVGLSPGYLARSFRRRHGHTLARYQLIQRIGTAQALLACTDLPVGEIGREIGLPDPHHFNKLFRRIAGQPPSAFRSLHRS